MVFLLLGLVFFLWDLLLSIISVFIANKFGYILYFIGVLLLLGSFLGFFYTFVNLLYVP